MLFTGVAFSITAFPVLCRILTELKLLDTTVGIVVLSAGVGNDIIGWTLLALSVALVNAGSGLTALYILLLAVGWTLFLLFVVRYGLLWLARKSGSIESGPTVLFMTVTILILFASSFFTDVIGVHAIFGAFVTGIIVPREGITWAYTIAIIGTAFIGKFSGCAISARYVAGFNWRESGAIDRTSAVMKSSVAESLLRTDPLLAVFKMFGQLNALPIRPALAIVPYDDLTHCVVEHAENHDSDMIMLTWLPPSVTPPPPPPTGTASGFHTPAIITSPSVNAPPEVGLGLASPSQPVTPKAVISHNPFDLLFKTGASNIGSTDNKPSSSIHSHFVRTVFSRARTDVALYIDQSGAEVGLPEGNGNGNQHLFLPFFGGPDDRLALEFVVQMCENEKVTASVLRVVKRDVEVSSPVLNAVPLAHLVEPKSPAGIMGFKTEEANAMTIATIASAVTGLQDTAYGQLDTAMRMQSETADNIIWQRYTSPSAELQDLPSLSRITFKELATPVPLRASIQEAEECRKKPGGGGGAHARLVIVVGRGRRLAVENHAKELKDVMGEYGSVGMEVKKTVGDVGTAFVVGRCGEGVVVLQEAVGEF
ncbi:hypothetical protein H0H93_001078 [Arthromyces matolae]|nr:hypothetical protein H0H93_001078 [Arthromyces matolae]